MKTLNCDHLNSLNTNCLEKLIWSLLTFDSIFQGLGRPQLSSQREPRGQGGRLRLGSPDPGRHLHGSSGCKVPHQVDGPGRPGLQQVHHQVWRLGFRYSPLGDRHLRHVSLPWGRVNRRIPVVGVWLQDGVSARLSPQGVRAYEAVLELGLYRPSLLPWNTLRARKYVSRIFHNRRFVKQNLY